MSRFGDLLGGKQPAPAPTPEPVVEQPSAPEEEVVEPTPYESDVSIKDMSKDELEEYGRTVGIELDRRLSHAKLVVQLKAFIDSKS